jgi:hypothetical protein
MKSTLKMFNKRIMIFVFLITFVSCGSVIAQKLRFGVFADPVISWFSSDTHDTESKGARTGFNFGLTYNKYFTDNYAFSTGINILNAGGQIVNSVPIEMEFKNMQASVLAGEAVIYKIQYLSVPVGLKFNTNQIGYVSFFTDLGLDPKVVIGGKADIPSPIILPAESNIQSGELLHLFSELDLIITSLILQRITDLNLWTRSLIK